MCNSKHKTCPHGYIIVSPRDPCLLCRIDELEKGAQEMNNMKPSTPNIAQDNAILSTAAYTAIRACADSKDRKSQRFCSMDDTLIDAIVTLATFAQEYLERHEAQTGEEL